MTDRFENLTEREKNLLTNARAAEEILRDVWFGIASLPELAEVGSLKRELLQLACAELKRQIDFVRLKLERMPVEARP